MKAALSTQEVTQLLRAWSAGDQKALDKLTLLVNRESRSWTNCYMTRQPTEHTQQTSALVYEIYFRLTAFREVSWEDRARFFAVCAKHTRHIPTEWVRRQREQKPGRNARYISLDKALLSPEGGPGLVALDAHPHTDRLLT